MAQILLNDTNCWTRLKMGDPEALGYLYDKYADRLFLTAMRITVEREVAKDALQDVFIECWNYRASLADITSPEAYLSRVLRNILVRKLKTRPLIGQLYVAEHLPCSEDNREDVLIALENDKQKTHRLKNALSNLTSRQILILKLRFYEGLSYEQIADRLSMNYQSVNNLAFRTIMRLRQNMYSLILLACALAA
jgi:RNA polymerase sigma factor (sigma-70 family)